MEKKSYKKAHKELGAVCDALDSLDEPQALAVISYLIISKHIHPSDITAVIAAWLGDLEG